MLFWLSLFPFATGWMGENHFSTWAVAIYGVVLMMAGIVYYILVRILVNNDVNNNRLAKAIGRNKKGILSVIIYFIAIPLAFVHSYIACNLYILVALIWLIPDNRIEKEIKSDNKNTITDILLFRMLYQIVQ